MGRRADRARSARKREAVGAVSLKDVTGQCLKISFTWERRVSGKQGMLMREREFGERVQWIDCMVRKRVGWR
jgi:hypothetical protein